MRNIPCLNLFLVSLLWYLQKIHTKNKKKMEEKKQVILAGYIIVLLAEGKSYSHQNGKIYQPNIVFFDIIVKGI